jgi:hypothetical protein
MPTTLLGSAAGTAGIGTLAATKRSQRREHGWSVRGALAALFAAAAICPAHAQTFFINQDFSTASGTTPPAGWTNNVVTGDPAVDIWRFNNPGGHPFAAPAAAPLAVFNPDAFPDNVLPEIPPSHLLR